MEGPLGPGEERILEKWPSADAEKKKVVLYFESSALNWRTIYHRQDVSGVIHQQRLATFLDWANELELPIGSHILDVGCGAGLAAVALAQRGYLVEAVDAASTMVSFTRQRAAETGVEHRVNASRGDVYHLAFPDKSFSLALSIGVIPWLQSPEVAISELARVLKPGGYLLMTADNCWRLSLLIDPVKSPLLASTKWAVKKILGFSDSQEDPGKIVSARQHSMQQVDDFFSAVALKRVRSKTLGFGPFTFFHREVFPVRLGMRIHRMLQWAADTGCPVLKSTGAQFLLLARKQD